MAASSSSSASRKQLARCLSSSLRPTSSAASPTSRRLVPVACIHTTTARSLPRAVKRATSAAPSSSSSSASPLPWFLEDQPVVEVDAPVAPPTPSSAASSSSSTTTPAEDLPLPPSISTLPIPLALLHTHLFRGPVYGLLHTPDPTLSPHEEGQDLEPWVSIHARALAGSTSWCDWVIIVTVRENHGGAINKRVAEEVGEVLRRVRPPRLEEEEGKKGVVGKVGATSMLEDLLGPGQSRSPFGPKSEAKGGIRASAPSSTATEGDADLEQSSPPSWATHRSALRTKFSSSPLGTTSWRPLKILSRETQNGLRALNASDPTRWRAASIAEYFKISPEAVRRILRADPSRWGGDNKEAGEGAGRFLRGEGEGKEGKTWEQREMDEIERIRGEIEEARKAGGREDVVGVEAELEGEGAAALFEGNSSEPTPAPAAPTPAPTRSPIDIRSLGKPRHPIRFEGLPASSSSSSSASARRRQQRNASSASSDNGSGGEWVLVDAGWCVVHVMTPRARQRYDVEGVWREAERERRRSGGGEAV